MFLRNSIKIMKNGFVCFALFGFSSLAFADMVAIPVPTRTIGVGDKINISDIVLKEYYVPENAAKLFVLDRGQVEGRVAKRLLLSGKPIALAYLKNFGLVTQGVPTKVILKKGGLLITTMLIPMESGSAGQMIEARNPESGKIVQTLVDADGNLNIGEP